MKILNIIKQKISFFLASIFTLFVLINVTSDVVKGIKPNLEDKVNKAFIFSLCLLLIVIFSVVFLGIVFNDKM